MLKMSKRRFPRFIASALAAAMMIGAAASNPLQVQGSAETASRLDAPEEYTFRDPSTTPRSFNPHDIEGSYAAVTSYRWYLSTPFAERVVAPEGSENFWEWKLYAAEKYEDVTADFADKEKYGIPADAEEGYVWVVDIRNDMKWHDGTPINAESYVNSTKHRFNPEMLAGTSTGNFGSSVLANARSYYNGETEWENVGIIASGDYQLTFVLETPLYGDECYLINGADMLVHEEIYTGGMETREDLLATTYMTTLETMASSGPYMIVAYEFDKQVVFERNPNWFGWFDEKFNDEWMATRIVLEVVTGAETQELLFNQGGLDRIRLGVDAYPKYRFSDYLIQYGSTNLYRFSFNSDLEKLTDIETTMNDGFNRRVLSVDEFRQAMSYALDRATFTQQTSAGWLPAVILLDNYYYDIGSDAEYRNTDYAKQAIVDFYGFAYGEGQPFKTLDDAYNAITGFNVEKARELFQTAYEKAVEEGIYEDGEQINIQFYVSASALTANHSRQEELYAEMLKTAAVGTGFEDNLTITFVGNFPDATTALAEGRIEAVHTAWGGSIEMPWEMIGNYTDATTNGRSLLNVYESSGWDPTAETLTLSFDFDGTGKETELTKTLNEWYETINGAGEYAQPGQMDTRLFILAQLETAVLKSYQTIPYGVQQISELHSMKVTLPEPIHPIFFEYSPRSQMKFNYTDAEWEAYLESNGGALNYE